MSGAGLQGFAGGLERGVGLANNLIDSKRRRQFEDEQMSMTRDQHDWGRERHGWAGQQQEWAGQQQERAQEQHQWAGQEQKRRGQSHSQEMRNKRLQQQKMELDRDLPIIQLALSKAASGEMGMLTKEEREAIARHPRFDPGWLSSDQVGQALDVVEATLKRAAAGEEIDLNDPKLIEAENIILEFDLNQGGGGSKKRILRQAPGEEEGTLVFELDVDGKPNPMTVGRGTAEDGDDEVLQQPLEGLVQRVAGMRSTRNALMQQGSQKMMQMAGMGGQSSGNSAKDQHYRSLIEQGVHPALAKGEAYGTIKRTQDPMGMGTVWMDIDSGQIVGELKPIRNDSGQFETQFWVSEQYGGQGRPQPPQQAEQPEEPQKQGWLGGLADKAKGLMQPQQGAISQEAIEGREPLSLTEQVKGGLNFMQNMPVMRGAMPGQQQKGQQFPQAEQIPGAKPGMLNGQPAIEYKNMVYPLDVWNAYIKQVQEAQHQTRSVEQKSMQTGAMRLPQGLMPQSPDQMQPY